MTNPTDWLRQLEQTGYCIIPQLVPRAQIADLAAALAPDFAQTPFSQGLFYGQRTKRFGRLLSRAPQSAALVLQSEIIAIAQAILGQTCDRIQLNVAQAIEIHPGEKAQLPHRDEDMWAGVKGQHEYLLNVMWPLDPFTPNNGATCMYPGSHRLCAAQLANLPDPVIATCLPGDAICFLGSTVHGAGANRSTSVRRALVVGYSLGWLKPYENPWLAYPPDVARHFPNELADLVGYVQHRPNLGNFEGQCPSILLNDTMPTHPGAIDALRPDQQAMLAAHAGAGGA